MLNIIVRYTCRRILSNWLQATHIYPLRIGLAVQNERDAIGKRPRGQAPESQANGSSYIPESKVPRADSSQDGWDTPKLLLESLIRSESLVNQLRDTVIKQADSVEYSTRPISKMVSQSDTLTCTPPVKYAYLAGNSRRTTKSHRQRCRNEHSFAVAARSRMGQDFTSLRTSPDGRSGSRPMNAIESFKD